MKHLGDITKIDWFAVEPVDVVTGGSPCQDLSVAGKRAGLGGERSGLYMEQIRCVKELREADVLRGRTGQFVRPRYMVWENVPGAFSSGKPKGADFAAVIEEIIKVAEPDAYVCVMPPDSGWTKSGCYYDSDGRWSIAWRVHDAQFWGVPQRRKRISLVADFGGLSAPEILFERKGLSGHFEQGGAQRKGAAAAVGDGTTGAKCYGIGGYNSEGDARFTISAAHCHAVYDARGNGDGNIACTITGDHENRVTDYTAIVSTYQNVTGPLMANSHPGSYCGQDAYQDMLVACASSAANAEITVNGPCPSLLARAGTGGNNMPNITKENTVRRLTPLECERLQGYPDGWTDIGEWVDSKGKRHKEADSPRYKALGNSIALPFWKWMLKRISAQYERDATLGSLFDGIGGFPLCWEQVNGKGSARWASEIEEFPMAVTKLRFKEE